MTRLLAWLWHGGFTLMGWALLPAFFPARARGRRHVPRSGPAILVANHESYLDPMLVAAGNPRRVSFLGMRCLFDIPLLGPLFRSLGAIPLDPGGRGLREAIRRLRRGQLVGIFPEGGRSPDGQLQPFHPGVTLLVRRSAAPVVPVWIEGAREAWPDQDLLFRRHPIYVQFGAPIPAETLRRLDPDAMIDLIRRRMLDCAREIERWRPDLAAPG